MVRNVETVREELAQVLKSTDVTVDIDFQGTTFFALWIEGLTDEEHEQLNERI